MNASLTPAQQDTLAAALITALQKADTYDAVWEEMTPRERRYVAASLARRQLRELPDWSRTHATYLRVGDDQVVVIPVAGGWTLMDDDTREMVFTTRGRWEAATVREGRVWTSQADAIEALGATL